MTKRIHGSAIEKLAAASLIGIVGCGIGPQGVLAQQPGSVTVEVGECVNLPSPEARFACYERQVEAARSTPTPVTPAPGAEPAGAPTAPAAPAEPTRDAEAADSQELTAIVTDVRQTVPNKLVITLDNGQVWRQSYAERYPLQRGQKVWVRPSRWGGVYWLGADELNGYIQVRKAE